MRKLSFEGSSFAGKTTMSRELVGMNPDRYKLINEYVVYAGGSEKFPPYPPKNKEEALKNLEFFMNLERKRHEDMQQYKEKPYVMVMDRSVISLLGFRFVQKYFEGIDIFEETKAVLAQEKDLAPDLVVYMAVGDEAIKQRRELSQRKVGELFVDPEFNKHLRHFFDWLIGQKQYPIVTVDTEKPFEQVKTELMAIADGIDVNL